MIEKIFLDSSCFIYFIENHPVFGKTSETFFSKAIKNQIHLVTSVFSIAEVLTLPTRNKDDLLIMKYEDMFSNFPNLSISYPAYSTALLAASIRGVYSFRLPDSFQLAIAWEETCKSFITNDDKLKKYKDVPVKLISEL